MGGPRGINYGSEGKEEAVLVHSILATGVSAAGGRVLLVMVLTRDLSLSYSSTIICLDLREAGVW